MGKTGTKSVKEQKKENCRKRKLVEEEKEKYK